MDILPAVDKGEFLRAHRVQTITVPELNASSEDFISMQEGLNRYTEQSPEVNFRGETLSDRIQSSWQVFVNISAIVGTMR